jgi:hypothetical protein
MEDRTVVVMLIMTWRRTIDTYSDSNIYESVRYEIPSTYLFCI